VPINTLPINTLPTGRGPVSRGAIAGGVLGLAVVAIVLLRVVPAFFGGGDNEQAVSSISTPSTATDATSVLSLTEAERQAAYAANLAFLRSSPFRNTNHDDSPARNVPSAELVLEEHFGPRSDYLGNPGGNAEQSFPIPEGGQFRAGCEFSHFAYDDPLVAPDRPGVSHLHMFFGNTDVNAFSTYDTLVNSGSSTCNGQELNRTGYWVPAMFDGEGNVRVPERVVVYYKGEGASRGATVPYPPGAAIIAKKNVNTLDLSEGGAPGKFSFVCSDQYSGPSEPAANTMPECDGSRFLNELGVNDEPHVVLEMNVKFPQCWNGQDPANWKDSFSLPPAGGWYSSDCGGTFKTNLPNLEYFVNYRVDIGESTKDWFLASDVDPTTFTRSGVGGQSIHGDWWGGWNQEVNKTWVENCVNFQNAPTASDCGFGYLTDGGPDGDHPIDGPALRYRPQYNGPYKIPASELFAQLCAPLTDRPVAKPEDVAYCIP
jgi:hypothetical protein